MISNDKLKSLFWDYAGTNQLDLEHPVAALDAVEEFTALAADGEIAGVSPEQDFPDNDLVDFENRVYHAIGLHVVYVPSEDSGSSRRAEWSPDDDHPEGEYDTTDWIRRDQEAELDAMEYSMGIEPRGWQDS